MKICSVADPDSNPDPSDPYVFGPPGSGSISQRYRSGSIYHQAKKARKTLIPRYCFATFFFFNYVNVPSKSKKFFVASWRSVTKVAGSVNPDPDPHQKCHRSATLFVLVADPFFASVHRISLFTNYNSPRCRKGWRNNGWAADADTPGAPAGQPGRTLQARSVPLPSLQDPDSALSLNPDSCGWIRIPDQDLRRENWLIKPGQSLFRVYRIRIRSGFSRRGWIRIPDQDLRSENWLIKLGQFLSRV